MAARVNVLQTVSQVLAKELGREAALEELSAKMKMTEDEVRDIMKLALDAPYRQWGRSGNGFRPG